MVLTQVRLQLWHLTKTSTNTCTFLAQRITGAEYPIPDAPPLAQTYIGFKDSDQSRIPS